jgi:acetate kinase
MASLIVLVLNSGSSSIKFSVYEAGESERRKLHEGAVDGIGTDQGEFWIKDAKGKKVVDETPALPTRAVAFRLVADTLHSKEFPVPVAIGHRMVSGGPTVQKNQHITPALVEEMERYTALAPLHTPIAIYIMREAMRMFPEFPTSSVWTLTFIVTCPKWSPGCPSLRSMPRWAYAATARTACPTNRSFISWDRPCRRNS